MKGLPEAMAAAVDPHGDDNPAIAGDHTWEVIGGGQAYRLTIAPVPIVFELDRPHWDGDSLHGLLTVKTGLPGAHTFRGVLTQTTFNCSAYTTRKQLAGRCKDLSRASQIPWDRLLEEFCLRVLEQEMQGEPAIDLRTVPRPAADEFLDIHGIRVLERHPIMLFGDGATFKSYLGLIIAGELARRGLAVLYADWELDAPDHRDRLGRLFGERDMPRVQYARCSRPLTAEIDRLARIVTEFDCAYLVCDSVAFACDGPPEAAEVAQRYFQCVRRLNIGSLHLAHINKSDDSDKKPFGSTFWHNGSRATWNVKQSNESGGGPDSEIALGFYNRKSNLGPLLPSVGLSVAFGNERTHIHRTSLADVADLAAEMTIAERMTKALTRPMTAVELAEHIDAKVDTVDKTARRKPGMFTRVSGSDGIQRIALVSRRTE